MPYFTRSLFHSKLVVIVQQNGEILRKIFLVLCAFLALALGVSAVDNEFKNMLINIDVDKISENAYKIDLLTQVPYVDEVKVVKKSDYHYYILLAETYSKPISKKIGDINPLEVQLFPYVEQGLSNGYTKITFNTTRPLDFTVSLKAKSASKYPVMDLVKLAKLDQMFAQNQTTVKGGKVLVASAPSAPVTTPATKPTVAATPATPATPVSKPTVVAQTPIKESGPVRSSIEVKPLPKPIAPSNEIQSAPVEPPASVKTAQKPTVVAPAAIPATAAPKVESKAAPTQKAAAPIKVAQTPQKQAAPVRSVHSQPATEPLYKPRKQAAHVPMTPPEEYEPVKPPVAQEPAAQEPSPAPEPEQVVQEQEPEPIAAAPEPQPELTLMERLAVSFENAKTNNPTLLIVLFLAIGFFMIALIRVASVNSNNKKVAQLAAQQKAQAEQEAQREQIARQQAQKEQAAQQKAQKQAQRTQAAQQMYTPPPMQPAVAPLVEPEVSRAEEAPLQDIDVEEIMAQVTPQDLAPQAPPQAQHVEVVELPPEAAPQTDEINLDDFDTFEISFEEHSEQVETYESEVQSSEEKFTKEIVSQLAPQFDELPELEVEVEADSEPAPQPVTLTFEDEFARPMGAVSPSIEQPAAQEQEPQEFQEPQEEPREEVEKHEPPRPAASEPLSLSSRPPKRTLRHRRSADSADILSKVKVEKDRGFYLADYQGVKALVGYIMDDIFVINTFKDKELKNPQIDFRLSESTRDGDYYLVRVDGSTMLVKSQKNEMSLASIMKPH